MNFFRVEFARPVFYHSETTKGGLMFKLRLVVALLGMATISPIALQAQAPAAPVPAQILTAKKVFISNAGVGEDRNFNEIYGAIKSWGQYQLVGAPADADLVIEASYSFQITAVSGSKESGCSSSSATWFKLTLLDPKTRIALWTVMENLKPAFRQKTGEKNLNDAVNALVDDLKALVAQAGATNLPK
jgi:hypothetical protein